MTMMRRTWLSKDTDGRGFMATMMRDSDGSTRYYALSGRIAASTLKGLKAAMAGLKERS